MTDSRKIVPNPKDEHVVLRQALTPLAQGLSSGVLCFLFSSTVRFRGGFVYGALSGIFDVVTSLGMRGLPVESYPIEAKALLYLAVAPLSWMGSYKAMNYMHAKRGNTLFRMTYTTAVGVGVFSELINAVDHPLLKDHIKPKC